MRISNVLDVGHLEMLSLSSVVDTDMICGALPILASLLSGALIIDLGVDYSGSHTRQGSPAAYYGETGYGMLNITLPSQLAADSFLWNGTNETGADAVYNTSLTNYAFRCDSATNLA